MVRKIQLYEAEITHLQSIGRILTLDEDGYKVEITLKNGKDRQD